MSQALCWLMRLAEMKLVVSLVVVGFWVIDFPYVSCTPPHSPNSL